MSLTNMEEIFRTNTRLTLLDENVLKLVGDLKGIDTELLNEKLEQNMKEGITEDEYFNLLAEICVSLTTTHYNYGRLGGRIIIYNLHKNITRNFSETIEYIQNELNIFSEEFYDNVINLRDILDKSIDKFRDYDIDYFGFKTLEKSYLTKINKKIFETPQYMFMRVAVAIHGKDIDNILKTYDDMSKKYYIHATPTLFNAGMRKQQLSSCYLIAMKEDSMDGIYDTLKECALISKWAGGIGLHIHQIRGKDSVIHSSNGKSDGIVPMLKVFNDTARYSNQCFTPDTIVFSKEGPKRMDEITTEDQLITIDGTFKNVNAIKVSNINKEILEVRCTHSFETIKVTEEHEIYTIKGQKKIINYNVIKNRLNKEIVKPEFTLAKDLTTDDFVGYPIPTYIKDVEFSEDFCRFYGIMLGDGSIHVKTENNIEYKVHLNNTTKKQTAEFVENYLRSLDIHYWVSKYVDGANNYSIGWSNKLIGISPSDLYLNEEKRIHPKFLHMPREKTLALIRGLLETDGSVGNEIYFSSTSYILAMNLRYLLLRIGVLCSGNIKNNIGKGHYITRPNGKKTYIVNRKLCYTLRIPKSSLFISFFDSNYKPSKIVKYFEWNSMLWSRIKNINKISYTGDIYDFNMIDNHNYTISSLGLVHNSGKRAGSFAIYLEPWHNDIESYLELKKNHGAEDERARDLFYALWIPDLFMRQVESNGDWYLMSPDESKGLSEVFGEEFESLYWNYVKEGKYKKKMSARDLWKEILISQIETGTPYMLYKDSANKKSNQQNLGTIKSSNLCVAPETLILTDKGHLEIKSLENQKVNIWNGEEFYEVIVKKTGENQELIDVETDDGCKLTCTKYHKFYIQNGDTILEKRAEELNIADTLIDYSYPILNNSLDISKVLSDKNENSLLKTKLDLQTLGVFSVLENNTLTITNKRPIKIKSIRDNNRRDDTYCFTEPKKHTGIFNGIITGQCSEIIEYSNAEETAVCNLASIGLPSFIEKDASGKKVFNHKLLGEKVRQLVKNLNKVIDINYYPTENCRRSNMRHRPIGMGVQGLADVFMELEYDWESSEAKKLNKDIFETIYYYALLESNNISQERKWWIISNFDNMLETFEDFCPKGQKSTAIASERGILEKTDATFFKDDKDFIHRYEFERIKHRMYLNPSGINKLGAYSTFEKSPMSLGKFQFDLWENTINSAKYNWEGLRGNIITYGIRNSLLTTIMPTASTSQILGFTECIEPITSNIYSRRTMAGEFIIVNKRLMKNLIDLGLWNKELKDKIIENEGSIQDIDEIPSSLKRIYKIVWEIKQKTLIDMSAERGHFICQSQSLNLFLNKIDMNRLGSMHLYAWKQGLKTGMYYLRTKTIAKTQKFTIEPKIEKEKQKVKQPEECLMCSS